MYEWRSFCQTYRAESILNIDLASLSALKNLSRYEIYPESVNQLNGSIYLIARDESSKSLIVIGEGSNDFEGYELRCESANVRICPLNHINCVVLRNRFSFTAPVPVLKSSKTIGLGDRLGLATPGHIRLLKNHDDIRPVFAQQSIRELNLTGRTYEAVLDDVSWAVFQEGYKNGFGADGDHLKKPEEIEMALRCGFTMITLDCSEHIDNTISKLDNSEVDILYKNFQLEEKTQWEYRYALRKFFFKDGSYIEFTLPEFKRIVLTYSKAIKFAEGIYEKYIKNYERDVSFEVSIDETLTSTSPQAHFLFASELAGAGVDAATMAPRFCGEFQKGIDYIGNINEFEDEFKVHAKIAAFFGYKISVHSGSDKFSVFPIVGRETGEKYHLKTAGTNWLEAVRVIAQKEPALYREIHLFALKVLDEARKYYHIGADINKIKDITCLSDEELPQFMDMDDSRQVLHITYGLILSAKNADGSSVYKDRIYSALHKCEEEYYLGLYRHIGWHLSALGGSL